MTCLKVGVMPAFHQLAPVPRLPFARKAATPSSRPLEAWTGSAVGLPPRPALRLPQVCRTTPGTPLPRAASATRRPPRASPPRSALASSPQPAQRRAGDLGLRDARTETEAG